MKTEKYTYEGKEYSSVSAVREAIWQAERKAFGIPKTTEEWAELGVVFSEEEAISPKPTIDELRRMKLVELNRQFDSWRSDGATLVSSLGFEVDADEKASADVGGLVTLGLESAVFMDANNSPHNLTLAQLKVLQKEIIQSGIAAYETKWAFRNAINSAVSAEDLEEIQIFFEPKDFTGGGE